MTVGLNPRRKKKKKEIPALELVADYLQGGLVVDTDDTSESRNNAKLQRSSSAFLFKRTSKPSNQPAISEYKEYLKTLAKTMPQPNLRKVLSIRRRQGTKNNPIIVVTEHK